MCVGVGRANSKPVSTLVAGCCRSFSSVHIPFGPSIATFDSHHSQKYILKANKNYDIRGISSNADSKSRRNKKRASFFFCDFALVTVFHRLYTPRKSAMPALVDTPAPVMTKQQRAAFINSASCSILASSSSRASANLKYKIAAFFARLLANLRQPKFALVFILAQKARILVSHALQSVPQFSSRLKIASNTNAERKATAASNLF